MLLFLTIPVSVSWGSFPGVFGLTEFTFDPPSGIATSETSISVDLRGIAGSSLTPRESNVEVSGNDIQLSLTNPYMIGATVLTPWEFSAELGPLPAGQYDIHVRSVVGTGEPQIGPIVSPLVLLAEGFTVVVPEMPGDFNGDREINYLDYDMWKVGFSVGDMSTADYTLWRDDFSAIVARHGDEEGAHAPEPESVSLLLAGLVFVFGMRFRRENIMRR